MDARGKFRADRTAIRGGPMAAMTDVGTVVETAMLVTGEGLVGIGSSLA